MAAVELSIYAASRAAGGGVGVLGTYNAAVFLLVTGASGAGKSTLRRLLADELQPGVECVELHDVVEVPLTPTKAWRQRATEAVVRHALELQAQGRDLLLAGDPVAAGELIAAPSADQLDGVAVCLLDVDPEAQSARLSARADDPALFADHIAFADWMRSHAEDPGHRLEVLQANGWEQMRRERCSAFQDRRGGTTYVLDTSDLPADAVAAELLAWSGRTLTGQAPVMRVRSWPPPVRAWRRGRPRWSLSPSRWSPTCCRHPAAASARCDPWISVRSRAAGER